MTGRLLAVAELRDTVGMQIDEFTPTQVGWLRGGNWAATQTALAMLHRRGAVREGRSGAVERVACALHDTESLERALYGVLYGATGPRELMNKPRVRAALQDVRRKVSAAGLVRPGWRRLAIPLLLIMLPAGALARLVALNIVAAWTGVPVVVSLSCLGCAFAFRRTIAGARTLRALRARYAELGRPLVAASALTPYEVGMAVALFGNTALEAVLAKAAHSTGLLDGGRWSRSEPQPAQTPVQDDGGSDNLP